MEEEEKKELLESLMDMVNQHFYHIPDTDLLSHSFMNSDEIAIEVLIKHGMAKEIRPNAYMLMWADL
jgi:hypothetical protein